MVDKVKTAEWEKIEMKRLDRIHLLLDEAHEKTKELLDEAYSFRKRLGPSGLALFREIRDKEKKDSILHRLSSSIVGEHAGRLEAERLAILMGQCLKQPRPRGALAALKRKFPKWQSMIKEYEIHIDEWLRLHDFVGYTLPTIFK